MSTIWELYKAKGLSLPGKGTIEDLTAHVEMKEPGNLTSFLAGFQYTNPALAGDLVAIERIALEFCEDAAHNGILYVESRFSPHLVLGESQPGAGWIYIECSFPEGMSFGLENHHQERKSNFLI